MSESHRSNYSALLFRFAKKREELEYKVACYVCAHPEIYDKVDWGAVRYPFEWRQENYDEDRMDLSAGVEALVGLGMNLYNYRNEFNLGEDMFNWGDAHFKMAIEAMMLRRGIED